MKNITLLIALCFAFNSYAFLSGPVSGGGGGGAVDSVNGEVGVVVLDAADVGADASGAAAAVSSTLSSHASNTSNPHSVTKSQVGLGNADNTTDLGKPVSTAQQTALDLKANLSLVSNVNNTSDANKPVSTAQQTALDLKLNNSAIVPSVIVYVDKNRADSYTQDGTQLRPWKTLDGMMDAITDNGAGKKYMVMIAPGSYVEDNSFKIKPYVFLHGMSRDVVSIKKTDSTSILIDCANNGSCRASLSNVTFTNGLTMDRTTATTGGSNLDMVEVTVNGAFVFNGIGGGKDFLFIRNGRFVSNVTVNAVSSSIFDSTILGLLTLGTTGGLAGNEDSFGSMAFGSCENVYIWQEAFNVATTHDGYYQNIKGTVIGDTLAAVASGTGTMTISSSAEGWTQTRSNFTSTGSVTLDLFTRAHAIGYLPVDGTDWANPDPTNVSDALDRLADKVRALNGAVAIP